MPLWQALLVLAVTFGVPAALVWLGVCAWLRRRNAWRTAKRVALWDVHVRTRGANLEVWLRRVADLRGRKREIESFHVASVDLIHNEPADLQLLLEQYTDRARQTATTLNAARYSV